MNVPDSTRRFAKIFENFTNKNGSANEQTAQRFLFVRKAKHVPPKIRKSRRTAFPITYKLPVDRNKQSERSYADDFTPGLDSPCVVTEL